MDLGTAVVTIAVGTLAVMPRVPALNRAGREQARIQRDCELWRAMPSGGTRDNLAADIELETQQLLEARARDATVQDGWLHGTAWTAGSWALLVVSTAISEEADWASNIRLAFQVGGILAGVTGISLLAITCALVTWKRAFRIYSWFQVRHGQPEIIYHI